MRYIAHILSIVVLCAVVYTAQAGGSPQGIRYQTMVRDAGGQAIPNAMVSARFTIHDGGPGGAIIYSETQTVVTNAFGTFSIVVGGGSIITGTFNTINWSTGNKYLQVEIDPAGGNSYIDMGTGSLLSVAYALYTNSALKSDADISTISYDSTGILNLQTGAAIPVTPAKPIWLTTGNAGLGNPNIFLGTPDNTDLIIKGRNTKALTVGTGGSLLMQGTATGMIPSVFSGAGARMMWAPGAAAFRAGRVSGPAWDSANIGTGSIALGTDVTASGANTIAIGSDNVVTGKNAVAMGNGLIAKSMNETVMGSYNDTTGSGSSTTWSAADPIFVVGNGVNAASRSNAMVVTKGGAITVSGLIVSNAISLEDTLYSIPGGTYTINPGNHSKVSIFVTNGGGADITMATSGFQLGQIVLFEVHSSSNGHRVTFYDNPGTYHTNINTVVSGGSYQLHDTDTITFMWDGSTWVELGHSRNY
ncbi:MAG: hypothetical protein JWO03_3998 [Bacteroidetes bacterium]|nr:hypothetical protein [Bacteroidota bacterium]